MLGFRLLALLLITNSSIEVDDKTIIAIKPFIMQECVNKGLLSKYNVNNWEFTHQEPQDILKNIRRIYQTYDKYPDLAIGFTFPDQRYSMEAEYFLNAWLRENQAVYELQYWNKSLANSIEVGWKTYRFYSYLQEFHRYHEHPRFAREALENIRILIGDDNFRLRKIPSPNPTLTLDYFKK